MSRNSAENARLEAEYGPAGVAAPYDQNIETESAEALQETVAEPVSMTTAIANALLTHGPLDKVQVEVALQHYELVESLLRISGPRFSNHRRDAAEYHNMALARFREIEAAELATPLKQDRAPLLA